MKLQSIINDRPVGCNTIQFVYKDKIKTIGFDTSNRMPQWIYSIGYANSGGIRYWKRKEVLAQFKDYREAKYFYK